MIGWILFSVVLIVVILLLLVSYWMRQKLFGHRFMPDPLVRYYQIEEFEGLLKEAIAFSRKKIILRGYLYSYPIKHVKVMIVAHGMWSNHQAYLQEIEFFARNGYLVIGFDYCGTDQSDGKNIKGLAESLVSLDAAVSFAESDLRFRGLPIVVFGHSWGGFAAGTIASIHPNIEKVVVMSGFISLPKIYWNLLPKALDILIPFFLFWDWIYHGKYAFKSIRKTLLNSHVDALIIHSKDDQMVSYRQHTAVLEKKLADQTSFLVVNGKNHNPDYTTEAINYMKEVQSHKKTLSKEEQKNYLESVDWHRMGQIDEELLRQVLDFLNS